MPEDSTMNVSTATELATLWDRWIEMWNGDLAIADQIIASDYVLHMSPIGGGDLSSYAGPAGMAGWIGQLHAAIQPFRFEVQVQPIYSENMIAGRWIARGLYQGGFPGAKAPPGTAVEFAGADFLRVKGGQITEYWLSADQLDLLTQLKMVNA